MARQRNQTQQGGSTVMATGIQELSQEQIDALLAGSRQRGEYDRQLMGFLDSDIPGVQVSLEEGPFQGKKAQSVKTGFDGAITRAKNTGDDKKGDYTDEQRAKARTVRTILNDDKVFLVNQNAGQAAE